VCHTNTPKPLILLGYRVVGACLGVEASSLDYRAAIWVSKQACWCRGRLDHAVEALASTVGFNLTLDMTLDMTLILIRVTLPEGLPIPFQLADYCRLIHMFATLAVRS
jgi:hypothetical protein